jgi:hypothetical protein
MLNRGYAFTTIISSKYHGRTLLSQLASLYPHSTLQAWQQKLNNREVTVNGVTATGSESLTSRQTLCGTVHPGSNQTPLSTSKSCLMTPICWPSTNLAGCPSSPVAASWKTPSCAWCKSKTLTQTLSTGWAEPVPASSSLPKHRRRPLNFSQTGTHPELKKSTERWLKTLHSTTPTKSQTHRPCSAPAHRFRVDRQPKWQTVKVLGEGDLTHYKHHNIRGKPPFGSPSSNQNPSGIHRPSPGRRSSVRLNRPAS